MKFWTLHLIKNNSQLKVKGMTMSLVRYGAGKVTGEIRQTTDAKGQKKTATVPLKGKKGSSDGK